MKTNSNSYTIIYSAVLVLVVAFLLAFVFQALKPMQDANVQLDQQKQILFALNQDRDMTDAQAVELWKKIIVADDVLDADGKVEVDTHAARIFMPRAELVDFEKELARIAKEKANAEKQLAGIENKLKNEGFLAKAPEAVINGARADAEKLKALIEKLDASAAAMKK